MKTNQNFEVRQGTTKQVTIDVDTEGTTTAKDLSGGSAEWYAFHHSQRLVKKAVLKKTGSDISIINGDDTNDHVRFTIQPNESARLEGDYEHEVWAEDATGNRDCVATGTMTVLPTGGKA